MEWAALFDQAQLAAPEDAFFCMGGSAGVAAGVSAFVGGSLGK